jgi:hypothetical protein
MPKGEPPKNPKKCRVCGQSFMPKSGTQVFCCKSCKRKWYRTYGPESTERQYELISGNWDRYFRRLCSRSFNRDGLTTQILKNLLAAQNGKCALTGVELTCILQKGNINKTNASIDRIDPKGPYTKDNIQLVCSVINKFRIDTPIEEFVEWCRKVANHAICQ